MYGDINYKISTTFIHTDNEKLPIKHKRPIIKLQEVINEGNKDIVPFVEINSNQIYSYLANEQSLNPINIDNLLLRDLGVLDGPFHAYYGVISALSLRDLYEKYGHRLFAKNIRFFKDNTDVKESIQQVLKTKPEIFFYYNNGIKLLCNRVARAPSHSADRKAGLFTLEDAHIINGVQTTIAIDTISNDGHGSNAFLEKAWVFVQIIDMAGNKNGESDLITKFSNTKNKIEIKDFVSRDQEQKRLFEDLSLSGIDYLYKTGAILENKDSQILLDEAIQAQACATKDLFIIALLKVNVSALIDNITKPPYKKLFNYQTNSFALYNNVQALRIVDNFVAQKKSSMTGKEKLTLIYGNRLLLFYVLKELAKISGYEDSLLNISSIANTAKPTCQKNSYLIYKAVLDLYHDGYLAHIFRSVEKLKAIDQYISDRNK